jgi:hypothetical protein
MEILRLQNSQKNKDSIKLIHIHMKKLLLKAIAGFFLMTIFNSSFAGHVLPIRTMCIRLAYDVVTIDGAADEGFWSALQTTDAFNKTGCPNYPDADLTVSFKVCYDAEYLYVWSEIKDDIDNSTPDNGATNPWTFDNVEIFLDLDTNNSGVVTAYDSNTIQLRINRGMDSVQTPGRAPRSAYKLYWENTSDGWLFEVAVPWKAVLASSEETADIMPFFAAVNGFDIGSGDSDGAAGTPDLRDCQTAWDNDDPSTPDDRTEDNAWNNRSVFGVVTYDCEGSIKGTKFNNQKFNIFPNPASNSLSVEQIEIGEKIEITNLLGQQLLSAVAVSDKMNLDITLLPAANMYLVKVTDKHGNVAASKFIKE